MSERSGDGIVHCGNGVAGVTSEPAVHFVRASQLSASGKESVVCAICSEWTEEDSITTVPVLGYRLDVCVRCEREWL